MEAIVCPSTVEFSTLFENAAAHRMPTLTLQLLKEMSITTPEDLYAAFPRLFDATLLEAELKKLSTAMKAKGDALVPQVVWTTNEAAEPGATEVPLLRRVVHRAKQAHQASLSFDKADAHRKEQKRLLKEEALGASKASERDAQRSLKYHNDLTDMCCYKVAPSDQAPPKVVCKVHDAMISGTLCAGDFELKKFVLRSQQIEASDKRTRIGEDGEITLVTKEDAFVNTVSVSDVLTAVETRENTMLATGFRPVQPVPGIAGMYSKGGFGYQNNPKVEDPPGSGTFVEPAIAGFWYYVCPHAMKRYKAMILNTLKVHHIQDIVTGDRLIMEQVINRIGEGFNISTAIVDTLDSTTISQLLAATGLARFPTRRGMNPTFDKAMEPTGTRGTKRGGDARSDTGKAKQKPPANQEQYRAGMDPCLKYTDGFCNDYNGRGPGCRRADCRYKHLCRACGSTDGHGAASCAKRPRR